MFFDIGFIVIISTLFAYIARLLKQPLILAYVLAGILLGPYLGVITDLGSIKSLSEIGIAFLLFIVGLEIDIKKLKDVGQVATMGGMLQMVIVFALAFAATMLIGMKSIEAFYFGLIIAFSSTMVVVKLLSDKREVDTLHGRIIIGILLLQDIIAILVMSLLGHSSGILVSLIKGVAVFAVAFAAGKYVLPHLFKFAASSQELLFIASLGVAFLFSIIADYIGFSIAVGAFMAGIVLKSPYNAEIVGKIKPLRDFFSVLFFVSLGMQLSISSLSSILKPLIVFIALVLLLKPLVVMLICSMFGYSKKTSFAASLSLAQISEFSLILAAQGMILGHISQELFSATVLLAVVTIVMTPYLINYSNSIYNLFAPMLGIFSRFSKGYKELEYMPKKMKNFVVLCGYNRIGYSIVKSLKKIKKDYVVVDFNPETVKMLIDEKVPCFYGDASDPEIMERLDLKNASMIISTVPDKEDNVLLIRETRKLNSKAAIFVTGSQIDDALELYDAGADYVILPHFLGGEHVSLILETFGTDVNRMVNNKLYHLEELKRRASLGHSHPIHA
ncbi:MAG: cation:proton antiporter [Nanoarchaeota archaeon]